MNLKYSYWYFKQALSPKVCDDMIKYGKSFQDGLAKIGGHEGDTAKINIKNLKKKRNSNIVWLNDPWIYNQIHPYVHMANKNAGWNFDWDYSESCQFTKYNKKQFYGWHRDSWEIPYHEPNNPRRHNKIRKLSVTISLSGPEDYKGGNLEFNLNKGDLSQKFNKLICKEIRPRGSIVVFPSFTLHRVQPVTKGTRYSLVVWNLGYPFR